LAADEEMNARLFVQAQSSASIKKISSGLKPFASKIKEEPNASWHVVAAGVDRVDVQTDRLVGRQHHAS
jgi:hypothetical protein